MSLGHIELQQRCRLPQKREGGKEGWDEGGRLSSLALSLPPHSSSGDGMSSGGGAGHRGGSSYGSSCKREHVCGETHISWELQGLRWHAGLVVQRKRGPWYGSAWESMTRYFANMPTRSQTIHYGEPDAGTSG
jgi:hypothetical protein